MEAFVIAVSRSATHTFTKPNLDAINLIAGHGVEGDAHAGKYIKHRFLVKKDPKRPNDRQIHLIHIELFEQLSSKGYSVKPGELGENITTKGIDLLSLPTNTKLYIGSEVVVELTGLRNPCIQIDQFQKGLLKEVLFKDNEGNLVRKTGVMGVILTGGEVHLGDTITVELPQKPFHPLVYTGELPYK